MVSPRMEAPRRGLPRTASARINAKWYQLGKYELNECQVQARLHLAAPGRSALQLGRAHSMWSRLPMGKVTLTEAAMSRRRSREGPLPHALKSLRAPCPPGAAGV